MNKPKRNQAENIEGVSGRDLFQTPNYATDLLIPFIPENIKTIWECAYGDGKISNRLAKHYDILETDIRGGFGHKLNFITDVMSFPFDCIITNPPFSLKRKFYEKCLSYKVPFALLIPADYSGWIIKAVQDGAEKIIPTRRIDYITPNEKESHAQFHSMWLTYGFNLGKSETFVELTNKEKKINI